MPRRAQALIALLCLLCLTPAQAWAAGPKLGVVDVKAAMAAAPQWKQTVAALEKERTEKQTALEAKQKSLQQRKEKLDAQKAISDPNTTAAAEEQLVKDAQELTQRFMQAQKELTEREKRLTDEMLSRVELIVHEIAVEGDYDFVFETGAPDAPNVLYAPKALDFTQKVIAEYMKRFKDKPLAQK